jgi:hypothetical protein
MAVSPPKADRHIHLDAICTRCDHPVTDHLNINLIPDGARYIEVVSEVYGEMHCLECECPNFSDIPKARKANKRADILKTAESLINGDRADTYGPPEISFGRIADLWNAMGLHIRDLDFGTGESRPVTAVDVALALTQLKVSRIIGQPDHEDSWVDAAGYIALGGEMATRKKES